MNRYVSLFVGGVVGGTIAWGAILVPAIGSTLTSLGRGWLDLWPVVLGGWVACVAVASAMYYRDSPAGRTVWTDEQRQALRDIKTGQV